MENFWPACLARLEQELNAQQFNTWIKPLTARFEQDSLRLFAPNRFVRDWIKAKYLTRLETLAHELHGRPVTLLLEIGKPLPPPTPRLPVHGEGREEMPPAPTFALTPPKSVVANPYEASRLNPLFTFASFVGGRANQLARAAAIQVAEKPGLAYNPMFVYGGTGLGKTHLIQAIGNMVLEQNRQVQVRYIHANDYVKDVVRAYQQKAFDELKRSYASLDLLLIDDIQFFAGKDRTQEEFFYTFNSLIDAKKQIIITCDTYPKEIAGMAERLISRFSWGLTVTIEPPELEMRVAILMKKAALERITLDQDVAFFIAKQIRSNVRELEGALKKVLAYSRFVGENITLELAKEALKDLLALNNRIISTENIQKTVADYYGIKVSEFASKKRSRVIARPRQIAMALTKELTQMSLPDIGEAFGGRDHTTVLHACRTVAKLRETHQEIQREYHVLLQILKT